DPGESLLEPRSGADVGQADEVGAVRDIQALIGHADGYQYIAQFIIAKSSENFPGARLVRDGKNDADVELGTNIGLCLASHLLIRAYDDGSRGVTSLSERRPVREAVAKNRFAEFRVSKKGTDDSRHLCFIGGAN